MNARVSAYVADVAPWLCAQQIVAQRDVEFACYVDERLGCVALLVSS